MTDQLELSFDCVDVQAERYAAAASAEDPLAREMTFAEKW